MSESFEKLLIQRPESMEQLIEEITPEIYANLKSAIELGKWDDGSRLSSEQLESSMQAVILYESKNLPPQLRAGFELATNCGSKQSASARIGTKQPTQAGETAGLEGRASIESRS